MAYIGNRKVITVLHPVIESADGVKIQQKKIVEITQNGTVKINADSGLDVIKEAEVTVAVPRETIEVIPDGYIKPMGEINIVENNTTVNVTQYASAKINIPTESGSIDTCTMEYVSGSDPLGIIYSNGAETTLWADTPTGVRLTVACNTPIAFYNPMGDDAPSVTLTAANGESIEPFYSTGTKRIYSIPSAYKNTHITISW